MHVRPRFPADLAGREASQKLEASPRPTALSVGRYARARSSRAASRHHSQARPARTSAPTRAATTSTTTQRSSRTARSGGPTRLVPEARTASGRSPLRPRPDLLDANSQAPRRAPRMAGSALLAQLVEHLHGKEGVDGSSPSEGSAKAPHNGASGFGSICSFSNVGQVWSPLWSLQVKNALIESRVAGPRSASTPLKGTIVGS